MLRLSGAVLHGLSILTGDGNADDKFVEDDAWAYDAFVRRYFQENSAGLKIPAARNASSEPYRG